MDAVYAIFLGLGLLGLLGLVARGVYAVYARHADFRFNRAAKVAEAAKGDAPLAASDSAVDQGALPVDYAPSSRQWSGSSVGELPLKMLTYRQYECLEDARYGFTVVGVSRLERDNAQPLKTRAHGKKTVASLAKHGFLVGSNDSGFAITDLGLNALAVCSVRY